MSLTELEQKINEILTSEIAYYVYIENLEKFSDKYTFILVNESGFPLDKTEIQKCFEIFDKLLKNWEFSYNTLFSPFETPHY